MISVEEGLDLLRARLADGLRLAVAITSDRDRQDLQVSMLNAAGWPTL